MHTTFQNAEKQHRRRKELERNLELIASAGVSTELEVFTDTFDIPGMADSLAGQPLTKDSVLFDPPTPPVRSSSRRSRGRLVIVVVAVVIALVVSLSMMASKGHGGVPTVVPVDDQTSRYRHIFSLILDMKVTKREDLETKDTPQAKALEWLAFQDSVERFEDLRTRFSLATLFFSTQIGEEKWIRKDKWLSPDPVCAWFGVQCLETQADLHLVNELNLSANGLGGTIPEEISLLERDCQVLDLSNNAIKGTIPSTMGEKMENLQRLYLGPNELESTIPETLYKLGRLTHLFIDSCNLIGNLTSSIGKMTSLHGIGLHGNNLSGRLPEELGDLTGLRVLNLDENKFKGPIPTSLGSLTGLVDLRLNQNVLTGPIPTQMSNMIILEILYLDNNQLSGKIPNSLANSLLFLGEFHVHNNGLTGHVPRGFGQAPFLHVLYFDGNNFTGTMPQDICERRGAGVVEDLWADCAPPAEVDCPESCCTRCMPDTR